MIYEKGKKKNEKIKDWKGTNKTGITCRPYDFRYLKTLNNVKLNN